LRDHFLALLRSEDGNVFSAFPSTIPISFFHGWSQGGFSTMKKDHCHLPCSTCILRVFESLLPVNSSVPNSSFSNRYAPGIYAGGLCKRFTCPDTHTSGEASGLTGRAVAPVPIPNSARTNCLEARKRTQLRSSLVQQTASLRRLSL